MPPTLQELKIPKPHDLGQHSPSCLIGRIRKGAESGGLRQNRVRPSVTFFCGIFTTVSRREAGPRAATQIKGRAPETSQKRPVLGSLGELRLRRKPAPRVHSSLTVGSV